MRNKTNHNKVTRRGNTKGQVIHYTDLNRQLWEMVYKTMFDKYNKDINKCMYLKCLQNICKLMRDSCSNCPLQEVKFK